MAFPPLGNSDHVVSVSIDFAVNSKQDTPFHRLTYGYSRADWDGPCDHLRDVPCKDIFNLSASPAASEFCEWVQVGICVYIPHCRYQVNPKSSTGFSAACVAAIVHRYHFFVFTNRINLLNRKCSSDRLVIVALGFLKLPNLHRLLKQKSPSLPRNLGLGTFGKLLIVLSTMLFLLYLLYSTDQRCYLLHLIKQNFLLKTFPRTQILMTLVSLYLFSLLELT